MKVKTYYIVVILLSILAGCKNLSVLPRSGIVPSAQEYVSFESASDKLIESSDPILEQAIRDLLKRPAGSITEAELLEITVLGDTEGNGGSFGDITGNITTLSDLKRLKNLTTLSLGNCGIKSLEGVEELSNLEILRLRRNNIECLEPLHNLVSLRELDLSENPINDTSFLNGLVNIEKLGLGDCNKIDLSCVSNMISLKSLYAAFSDINDISMLSDKYELDYLEAVLIGV